MPELLSLFGIAFLIAIAANTCFKAPSEAFEIFHHGFSTWSIVKSTPLVAIIFAFKIFAGTLLEFPVTCRVDPDELNKIEELPK